VLHQPDSSPCELCAPTDVVLQNALAYVRYDNHSLSRGHVLVVPKRHVSSFFDMSSQEQVAVLQLLGEVQRHIQPMFSPDGYNIGVNVGAAAGQSRMHVHVHLIPRYLGDVPDPSGGIRCVLTSKRAA
jgi:diadenosine tetraphosphate (Ap4A) HIT family hydrolase